MTKVWKCTQCGTHLTQGLLGSVRGEPEECEHCGNDGFSVVVTRGPVHRTVERFVS